MYKSKKGALSKDAGWPENRECANISLSPAGFTLES